ncbi:TPA: hypothetical protein TUR69_001808, partial [Streptococcus equi subsp. zooepidemicus]|nr:hypothetical protein [Streptococcus equi subsp. zooepidemicus]
MIRFIREMSLEETSQKTNGTHKEPQIKEELMTKVRKAIIPAAGLGTRFLPATKALAK